MDLARRKLNKIYTLIYIKSLFDQILSNFWRARSIQGTAKLIDLHDFYNRGLLLENFEQKYI